MYEEHYQGEIDLDPEWLYWLDFGNMMEGTANMVHKRGILHLVVVSIGQPCKSTLKKIRKGLEGNYGLKVHETAVRQGIVTNDMFLQQKYVLGDGNVLLVGEAAGFIRALDGITSALITGKAAGESVLKSIDTGEKALTYYSDHELILSEKAICAEAHRRMMAIAPQNG
jgi:flavin-dependent dehydrogenase